MRDPFEWADSDDDNMPIHFPNYLGDPNYPVPAVPAPTPREREREMEEANDTPWPAGIPEPSPPQPERRGVSKGHIAVAMALALSVGYCSFVSRNSGDDRLVQSPAMPGWDELGSCTETISLDEEKTLTLADDGSVTLVDYSKATGSSKEAPVEYGQWRYEPEPKRYAVVIGGLETRYLFLSMDNVCALIKGDLRTADLTQSWFSTVDTMDYDPGDYESPPDRY
jgi:hypothetical protein